jgi:hypothetical protein
VAVASKPMLLGGGSRARRRDRHCRHDARFYRIAALTVDATQYERLRCIDAPLMRVAVHARTRTAWLPQLGFSSPGAGGAALCQMRRDRDHAAARCGGRVDSGPFRRS